MTIDKKWKHAGLVCVLRHGAFDAPCGYVAVPKDSPLYRKHYSWIFDNYPDAEIPVEITFEGSIDDEDEFFLGFDMAHACDLEGFGPNMHCIRTDEECIKLTNEFAEFIADFKA